MCLSLNIVADTINYSTQLNNYGTIKTARRNGKNELLSSFSLKRKRK